LQAWADSLTGIHYPLLSDFWPHGEVALRYGVLRSSEGRSERAIFIVDRAGIIRYIDIHDIDLQPDNEDLFRALRVIDPEAAAHEPVTEPEVVNLPHGGIVMYCTPWCPDCRKARAWLKDHNLVYTEVNIPTTAGASAQVKAWTGGPQTTPTFDIDGTIVVDFDEPRLRKMLGVRE
jgi:glutaredoxin